MFRFELFHLLERPYEYFITDNSSNDDVLLAMDREKKSKKSKLNKKHTVFFIKYKNHWVPSSNFSNFHASLHFFISERNSAISYNMQFVQSAAGDQKVEWLRKTYQFKNVPFRQSTQVPTFVVKGLRAARDFTEDQNFTIN